MTTKESILSRLSAGVKNTEKELYTEEELNKFAEFYLDKWDENTNEDVIAESFVDFWWNTGRMCRRCSVCGKLMREGYCANSGDDYYCSDDCLHECFTPEAWEQECSENSQSYWTEWY